MPGKVDPRLLRLIDSQLSKAGRLVLAIDGPCASGKSTLAANLQAIRPNSLLIHTDDFFLQPHQRNEKRLSEPGGNLDRERLTREVLQPLQQGQAFVYHKFDCHSLTLHKVTAQPAPLVLLEGVYAHHPAFAPYLDQKVFLHAPLATRLARLENRVGQQMLQRFLTEWIPLEEIYFAAFSIRERADLVLDGQAQAPV